LTGFAANFNVNIPMSPTFVSFCEHAVAVAIPKQNADLRGQAIQEDEQISAQWAQTQLGLHHRAQTVETFSEIGR
jgi:hypothetical protein